MSSHHQFYEEWQTQWLLYAMVLLEYFLQLFMWQRFGADALMPGHILGCDHGIDNCLFCGVRGGHEQGIDKIVAQSPDRRDTLFITQRGIGICSRESQEDISGAVAAQ